MSWIPAYRNPIERDARIETHGGRFRVEVYRGGKLQAVRTFEQLPPAIELVNAWLVLGPAIFALERVREAA